MPYPQSLKKSLMQHCVDETIFRQIYDGYEDIKDNSPKTQKTPFMRRAMEIMDKHIDSETCYKIIDGCACSLGGSREKNVKKFIKSIEGKNLTFEEKVQALSEAKPFYNSTRLNNDGTITDGIYYQVEGEYKCACPCLSNERLNEPISATYCLCCAGHYRHHLQNALGLKLKTMKVVSSPIESLGKKPCVFVFDICN